MSELKNLKRRFIAGAVCPRCKAMDTVIMYRVEGRDYRECVSCDFEEGADFSIQGKSSQGESTQGKSAQPEELPTRVNQNAAQDGLANPDIQVVKILEPVKNSG